MKIIKHIDTWSILERLRHNIYIKIEDHVETNVNDKVSAVFYENDEIDKLAFSYQHMKIK
jgi:hypothetical protein